MIAWFNLRWHEIPTVWIDVETTGTRPGNDHAVSVALVRFEGGKPVGQFSSLVRPGMAIPAEATGIHGITDDDCVGAPWIQDLFSKGCVPGSDEVCALLAGAQPAAYNAPFDRHFVPPFGEDWTWPWLDALSLVRKVDRFAKGQGRHKLAATCARHGIELAKAHDAGSDARAAGELFYKIAPQEFPAYATLGSVLAWQRRAEAEEWFRFNEWLARQPPRESVAP